MATQLDYIDSISAQQGLGIRLAGEGRLDEATAVLTEAYGACEGYGSRELEKAAHRGRIRRDIGAVGIRSAMEEYGEHGTSIGMRALFAGARSELTASWISLRELADQNQQTPHHAHLLAETGASATWLMRLQAAWGVADTANRNEHWREASRLGQVAGNAVLGGDNQYYKASWYANMARLAVLRGTSSTGNLFGAWREAVKAIRTDSENLRPALRTAWRVTIEIALGRTDRNVRAGKV